MTKPLPKTFKEAEKYGEAHYLKPEYKLTIHGSWKVEEGYGKNE